MSGATERVRRWLDDSRDAFIDELAEWARIRSVGGRPEHEIDLQRSAHWLAGALREVGFPTVEIWPADGGPTVWAEWPAPADAPTVLIYSHHDVRAAKDDLWQQCPPFEPALRDGRLYGRGTSDAKGQVLAHLWGLRALLANGHDAPPVGLKVLVEGEEETGSASLAPMIDEHRDRVNADFVVLSDTMTWAADEPAVCIGARGLVKAQLELRGPLQDIHSGAVSGVAPNPVNELIRLLSGLHDEQGRVALPGFYDDVAETATAEQQALAALTGNEEKWLARTGTRSIGGEAGRSIGERLYTRPAAEILTIAGGDPEPPSRGVIPAVARADIQLSLVPDQHPDTATEQLRTWIAKRVSDRVDWSLEVFERISQPPCTTPRDHPALGALHEAMSAAWGTSVGWMRNAGSGPGALLSEKANAPVLFFGTGLPDDNWHGPDESAHIGTLLNGAATMALFWPLVAERVSPPRR